MTVLKVPLIAYMDGGEPIEAQADQRDFAAWEAQPEAENDRAWQHTRFRFLAWHAARRTGAIDKALSWPDFNEKCVQVNEKSSAAEEEPEGEQEGDPTVSG